MTNGIESDFERMSSLVLASDMADDDKQMAVGCLKKLPGLCEAFCRSYESRDVEEILRLERGMLARLTDPSHPSPPAQDLAKSLTSRLKDLHERLGLPEIKPSKSLQTSRVLTPKKA